MVKIVDICEECGFYREVWENKNCTQERYCERLDCFVEQEGCKSIKYVFDKVCGNEYASREECCEYTKNLIKLITKG